MWRAFRFRIGLAGLLLSAIGCDRSNQANQALPPPPAVTFVHPIQQQVTEWDEYPGRLESPDEVLVRARVNGFIIDAPFVEGAIVEKDKPLFLIDPRPYQADLARTNADLERAQAQQRFAQSDYERLSQAGNAASGRELSNAKQTLDAAVAAVNAAKAAVDTAKLNVEWCTVTAPIKGRVGQKLVTVGNLVNASQATELTSIRSLDPIYCYIDVDERTVMRYQRQIAAGSRPSARETRVVAQLSIAGENDFRYEGYIDFINNQIQPGTGTIRVRGNFPNPTYQLLPGQYVRMRIPGRSPHVATLVPEAAIGSTLAQEFVMVVGANDVVEQRPVTGDAVFQGLREVEGVTPADRVIVTGLVTARPGTKVLPRKVAMEDVAQLPRATRPAGATQPAGTTRPANGVQAAEHPPRLGQGPNRSNNGPAAAGGGNGVTGGGGAGTNGATGGGAGGAGSSGGARP